MAPFGGSFAFLRSAVRTHCANLNSISKAIGTFGIVGRFSDCHASVSFQFHGRSSKAARPKGALTCPMTTPLGGTPSNLCAAYRSKASNGQSK